MMPMQGRIGEQFGSFELIQFLGRGGFAEVYLGKNTKLSQQLAAIKILEKQLVQKKAQQFKGEAGIVATLRHPHIVQMYDYNVYTNVTTTLTEIPYIIMEYASNGSLRKKHSRGIPLSLSIIATYIKQIADALQFAHNNNVMHLDVKPENILINTQNQLLLSDFGLATLLSEQDKTADIQGTLSYMSPEQLNGIPDFASDQYSLGIMIYEWICGNLPFTGHSIKEVIDKHLNEPPPSLCLQVAQLPSQVETVVMKALSKKAIDRFSSVNEFAKALEQAINAVGNLGNIFSNNLNNQPPSPPGFSFPQNQTPFPDNTNPAPGSSPFFGLGMPGNGPYDPRFSNSPIPGNPDSMTIANLGPPSIPSLPPYLRGTKNVVENTTSNSFQNNIKQYTSSIIMPKSAAVLRRRTPLLIAGITANTFAAIFISVWLGQIMPSQGNETAWWVFIFSIIFSFGALYLFFTSGNKFLKSILSILLSIYWGYTGFAFATLIGAGTHIGLLPDASVMAVLFLFGSLGLYLYLTFKQK